MLDIMREHASGWIIKVLFAIIILAFVLTFGMGRLNNGQDPTLATVNDEIITRAEFEDAFQRAAENLRKANPNVTPAQLQDPQFKQMVLGELINSRLLLAEAARLGVSVSDAQVFAAISRQPVFWNQQKQFDRNLYQMALRSVRMTPPQFEANFKKEMVSDKIMDMVRATGQVSPTQARQIFNWITERATMDYILIDPKTFMDGVDVTGKQVEDFYAKNESRFMVPARVQLRYLSFTPKDLAAYQKVGDKEIEDYYAAHKDELMQKEQVEARHILVQSKDSDSAAAKQKAKEKIASIYAKAVKPGADFAKLARKYSEGPSAPNGGELGWFGRGDMVPAFEKAAFSTPKGKVCEPIKTQFGWHIIYVQDRKEAKEKTLADVKDEISRTIAEEKASDKSSDLLDQAMDRLVSGMKLDAVADELGLLAVTSQPVPENMLPQTFGLTPEAAKVLMKLPEGEAHSTPLAVDGGYMLVEKVKDIPSAPLPLEKVKDVIIQAIKQDKARELAQKKGEDILTKLKTDPKAFDKMVKTSQPFTRKGDIPELGSNPNLAAAIFQARNTDWLPQPFTLPVGTLVVRRDTLIPSPDAVWTKQKDAWIAQANKNYEAEALNAFMTKLHKSAKIEISRPDLLN